MEKSRTPKPHTPVPHPLWSHLSSSVGRCRLRSFPIQIKRIIDLREIRTRPHPDSSVPASPATVHITRERRAVTVCLFNHHLDAPDGIMKRRKLTLEDQSKKAGKRRLGELYISTVGFPCWRTSFARLPVGLRIVTVRDVLFYSCSNIFLDSFRYSKKCAFSEDSLMSYTKED